MTHKPRTSRLDPAAIVARSEKAALLWTKGVLIPKSDPNLAKLLKLMGDAKPQLEGMRVPPERAAAINRDVQDTAAKLGMAREQRAADAKKRLHAKGNSSSKQEILAELTKIETRLNEEHVRFCRSCGLESSGVFGYRKGGPSARNHSLTDGFAGGRYFIALGKVMRSLIAEIREGLETGQDVTEPLTTLRRVARDGMKKDEAINFLVEKTTNGKTHYV